MKFEERVERIIKLIDDKKGENIEKFDLRNTDYFADEVIVATTMAQKHGAAILDELKNKLKPDETFLFVEESDEWIVIDLGDILIHLLSNSYREKYQIEKFLEEFKK